jgi:hypothetical protein
MIKPSSGETTPEKNSAGATAFPSKYDLLDLQSLWFLAPGNEQPMNLEDCSNDEFFRFIEQYVQLTGDDLDSWSLEERCEVLNFAIEQGQQPNFLLNHEPNFSAPSEGQQREESHASTRH